MIWCILLPQHSILQDLFTTGSNGETSSGLNLSDTNCMQALSLNLAYVMLLPSDYKESAIACQTLMYETNNFFPHFISYSVLIKTIFTNCR